MEFDDRADSEEIENLLEQLAQRGFEGKAPEATDNAADIAPESPDTAAENEAEEVSAETETSEHKPTQGKTCESIDLTITLPLESVAVGNLTKLLEAKGSLIKKALGVNDLGFEINEESKTICFPWFGEEAMAYTHFVTAFCKMTKDAKRVTAKEKNVDNEKYAFRCFLLRLGFIGTEYKAERKILLRNLSGSSAFKAGRDGEQE